MSEKRIGPALPADIEHEIEFPVRAACIDVGSNAIRFVAAEFEAPDRFRTIEQERAAVRLGHDVFLTGRLAESAMAAAGSTLASFWERMAKLDVDVYRAVATSAVRESSNGEQFVQRVREQSGLQLEVISGSEEARLVYAAVRRAVALSGKDWIVVDVGGGSVEILLVDDSGIMWSELHTMGSVRLLEELSEVGEEPGRFRRLLEEYTATLRLAPLVQSRHPAGFVATGGNAETLAQLAGTAAATAAGLGSLSVDALRNIIERLSRLSYRQRVQELGLREDRADVILPAAMVYEHLAGLSGASVIVVPGVGIKEGVLYDLVEAVTTKRAHADRRDQELANALLSVGRRFMFDEGHARQVARHSLALFDQLADAHRLGESSRRILQAAAWLHDIGSYISYKRHHKHSMYLIAQSELPGFSAAEIALVSLVARYHRKSEPGPQHEEFVRLKPAEQNRVLALAAILRLADALDREHRGRVRAVTVELQRGKALLRLEGSDDLLLEKWALKRKSALFERVFERELRVRNGGEH